MRSNNIHNNENLFQNQKNPSNRARIKHTHIYMHTSRKFSGMRNRRQKKKHCSYGQWLWLIWKKKPEVKKQLVPTSENHRHWIAKTLKSNDSPMRSNWKRWTNNGNGIWFWVGCVHVCVCVLNIFVCACVCAYDETFRCHRQIKTDSTFCCRSPFFCFRFERSGWAEVLIAPFSCLLYIDCYYVGFKVKRECENAVQSTFLSECSEYKFCCFFFLLLFVKWHAIGNYRWQASIQSWYTSHFDAHDDRVVSILYSCFESFFKFVLSPAIFCVSENFTIYHKTNDKKKIISSTTWNWMPIQWTTIPDRKKCTRNWIYV